MRSFDLVVGWEGGEDGVDDGGEVAVFGDAYATDAGGLGSFDVAGAVSDEEGTIGVDVPFANGLEDHSRGRFATGTRGNAVVVGTIVESIDMCPVLSQHVLDVGMEAFNIRGGIFAFGDAALVGDDDDQVTGLVEATDAVDGSGVELEIFYLVDVVVTFIGVYGSVAV